MLTMMRNQKKVLSFFLWLVIVAFIGTIFLVWGMGGKTSSANYAIKVNDYKISYREYQNAYENMSNTLRQLFGDQVNEIPEFKNLSKAVVDDLVNKYLLIEEANKRGVFVSDTEVLHAIATTKSFQVNGRFDQQRYIQVLSLNGINPETYEASIREGMLVNKMESLIRNSVNVTDQEIEKEYIYRNSSAVIRYLSLEPEKFRNQVAAAEEDVKAFYEENKENYRVPEKIKVKYVVFDEKDYNTEVKVTDQEAENYFLQNKTNFHQDEQLEARHILVRVKDFNDKKENDAALKKINDALKEIEKGKSFAEVAKKYSEDTTAANGGYLGFFKKGVMVKEFEDAAFGLKPGEVSKVVKSPFGYHIIKVEKKLEDKDLSFEEAKAQIIQKIKSEKEKAGFKAYIFDTYRDILNESNITAYLKKYPNKMPVYETNYFSIDENVAPFGNDNKVKSNIFKLDMAEISSVVDLNGKKYIFELEDRKESYIPTFDEIKDTVKSDYVDNKALEISKKALESELDTAKSVEDVAKKLKITYTTTPSFKRLEPIPSLGADSNLVNEIYKVKKGIIKKVYVLDGRPYLVEVLSVEKPDMAGLADEKENLKAFLLTLKQDEAFKSYIESLKNKAEIYIDPNLAN
ncbi:SurA N-terminal domain-containing protein [Deferribacteraceae bacterium V6Fe1]|nr:SurA N-terminal domain-containing protein [Deferribacteraceae bacterium V6Fe1]